MDDINVSLGGTPALNVDLGESPEINLNAGNVTVNPVVGEGKSAYEVAVANGFEGTEQEWLDSLVGEDGASAYEIAAANGFEGSESEWLESLRGADGESGQNGTDGQPGASAYEIAAANGFEGSESEWLESLRGADGENGQNGTDGQPGASAYQIAVTNGFEGSESEWLESLRGADGENGQNGTDGQPGASAYEIAAANGFEGSESEWLESLKGADGADGQNGADGQPGASAYEIAAANGFEGSESEWLESLRGADGTSPVISCTTRDYGYDLAIINDPAYGVQSVPIFHGSDGKSAYQTAVDGGYTGSEQAFIAALNAAASFDSATTKYLTTITGDGSTKAFTVTHNLGHQYVLTQIFDANRNLVHADVNCVSETALTVTFAIAPTSGTTYIVLVLAYTSDALNGLNSPVNMWDSSTALTGYYVVDSTGALSANAAMAYTDYLAVKGGTAYVYSNSYVRGAFYDADKAYISGFNSNNEYNQTYPTALWYTVTTPDKAKYVRLSTRLGNRDSFVFSEFDSIIRTEGNRMLSKALVPRSHIVSERNNVIYDEKFIASNPSELTVSKFSYANDYMTASAAGAMLRYAKYVTIDRSKISMVFKMTAGSSFRFGYSAGSVYNVSGVTDNAFGVTVDSAAKTMTAYTWDGTNTSSIISLGKTVSFDFDIADGSDYYMEIEKRTVNEVCVRLFRADCSGEVAEMLIQATESSSNSALYTGYARCWGGGALQLISGSISVSRFTMISTGNQYPKTMIIGDSYVEHAGRNPLCGYGQRLYEATNGDVFLDGRGGATAADTLKRIVVSLNCCQPQYVVLNVGVNDSASVDTDTFIANLNSLISIVKSKNAIPVLITVPRLGSRDNSAFMETVNAWVKASGHRYIDLAAVLSTGDGVTHDAGKFVSDGVHPNIEGGEACFRYIEANLPELIY